MKTSARGGEASCDRSPYNKRLELNENEEWLWPDAVWSEMVPFHNTASFVFPPQVWVTCPCCSELFFGSWSLSFCPVRNDCSRVGRLFHWNDCWSILMNTAWQNFFCQSSNSLPVLFSLLVLKVTQRVWRLFPPPPAAVKAHMCALNTNTVSARRIVC